MSLISFILSIQYSFSQDKPITNLLQIFLDIPEALSLEKQLAIISYIIENQIKILELT
jgi:hypothetical protein